MALVPCSNCGELISDQADFCPHCFFEFESDADGIVIPERPIRFIDLWTTYKALMSDRWTTLALNYAAYGMAWIGVGIVMIASFFVMDIDRSYGNDFAKFLWVTGSLAAWMVLALGAPTAMWVYVRRELGITSVISGGYETLGRDVLKATMILVPITFAVMLGSFILIIPGLIIGVAFWCAPYLFVHENRGFERAFKTSFALFKLHTNTMLAAMLVAALIVPLTSVFGGFLMGFMNAIHPILGFAGGSASVVIGLIGGFLMWTWSGTVLTAFIHPEIIVYTSSVGVRQVSPPAVIYADEPMPTKMVSTATLKAASPQERLKALSELRESGLINDDDFERKKLDILSDL